ncbi:MAG TPA: phosphoribosylglycinamide formyltransferase [Tepidisphaeraceae bacterium]|jgi:formyltetrahydrofolate-dependent phosphoribosylglycinamide formyltransferase
MGKSPIKLAVLVSGGGTTLQNLLDEIRSGRLNAQIPLVIGSRPELVGLERAAKEGIRNVVVDRRTYPACADFSRRVVDLCAEANVDLVCLAGWLCLLDLPDSFLGKVMNIHPALLPSFGGRGMYGRKVHEAVLAHGCKLSGCTVHFVDNTYDTGPIILQRACPVLDGDTPETLAHRVFDEEKIAYPEAIRLFQQGRLKVEGRRVRLLGDR